MEKKNNVLHINKIFFGKIITVNKTYLPNFK